ncbi:YgjP-like metallopeptidase domain-containing protein [Hydrogenobacter hydrogenophilus]|uniref:Predicted metal-dependent hydrolase n=1 Tax=Hydrogenobacter hydrogenophilus TaxID=35835 RepID=A0A285P2C9_9AQUI|nr:YgjP-like metallopeptidase domain-containing protein [Hydrogenobacter hydrogenophilus]SNZ15608.1 Predicted metal-dependent hydrolase [Hydrogenobacter hydrogenophilus]
MRVEDFIKAVEEAGFKFITDNITNDKPEVILNTHALHIFLPKDGSISLEDFIKEQGEKLLQVVTKLREYKEEAKRVPLYEHENLREIIESYIEEFSKTLGVKPGGISITRMGKSWIRCVDNFFIFSEFLKYLPEELIRHVVACGMCYLAVKNNGPELQSLLKKLDPDAERHIHMIKVYRVAIEKKERL